MKKILSAFLAAVMIVSVMSVTAFVSTATPATHTLDEHNVGIDVPYFSGETIFYDINGKSTADNKSVEEWGPINFASKTGDGTLNLDGSVTEAEWGKPLVEVSSKYAATFRGTTPSSENTYFWYNSKRSDAAAVMEKGMNFKMWMAWDEDYLYIAAVVDDPDSPMATQSGGAIWNGDTLQLMIDPEGPNSIVGGHGFDPAAENPFPWNSMERAGGQWKNGGLVANIGASYIADGNLGYPDLYDMSTRYDPKRVATWTQEDPPQIDYWSTNWYGYDINYMWFNDGSELEPNEIMNSENGIGAFAAILPVNMGTRTNQIWQTTYELAIPWTLVSGTHYEFEKVGDGEEDYEKTLVRVDPDPKAGDEYGISVGLLNGVLGASDYNSWLTWGSGIFHDQTDGVEFVTAGGSNSMVLSADELGTIAVNGTAAHEHVFAEATCETPETCTICGYQRGFATGHYFEHEIVKPLSKTEDGVIRSTCKWCNATHDTVVSSGHESQYTIFNDSLEPNSVLEGGANQEWSAGWNYIYKVQKIDDNPDNTTYGKLVDTDTVVFNPDGSQKMSLIKGADGKLVFDFTDHRAGTYFETRTSRKSYSMKYQIQMAPDMSLFTEEPSENYVNGFYNWFGGKQAAKAGYSYGMNYAAGFFPTTIGSTSGTFKIMDAVGMVIKDSPNQRVYFETPVIDLGTDWHDIEFVFDESAGACFFYLDDECIMAAAEEGMKMPGGDQVPLMRRMDTALMVKGLGYGETAAFLEDSYTPAGGDKFTVTCDGEVIGSYDAGETVELPVPEAIIDMGATYRFYNWNGAEVARSAFDLDENPVNGYKYTLVMPGSNVVLTSVRVLIGDVNLDGSITLPDVATVKLLLAGSTVDDDRQTDAGDINFDGLFTLSDLGALKKMLAG